MSFSYRTLVLAIFTGVASIQTFAFAQQDSSRKWTDKTGKFTVDAKLLEFKDGQVKLLKNDGRAITLPLIQLSEADQTYLKNQPAADENPFAGGEMIRPNGAKSSGAKSSGVNSNIANSNSGKLSGSKPAPSLGSNQKGLDLLKGEAQQVLPQDGEQIYLNNDEPLTAIEADPDPNPSQFFAFTRPLEDADAYTRVSEPILIDAQTQTYAVSLHRLANAVAPANFGRIYLINKSEKRPRKVMDINDPFLLIDHNSATEQSVGILGPDGLTDRGGDLVLLKDLASGEPTALARWHLPEWNKPGFAPKVESARLIGPNRVLARVNSTIYLWDMREGTCHFFIKDLHSGDFQVSGSGKYLAIPVSGGCKIIDVDKAELLGMIKIPTTLTPEIRFSPDGTRMAMSAGNQVFVWHLVNGDMTSQLTLELPCGKFFGWVGADSLLTQLAGLIDLETGKSIWRYSLPSNNQAHPVQNGVVAIDRINTVTLMSLPVPHPPANAAKKMLSGEGKSAAKRANMYILAPGSKVSVKIDAVDGVDQNAMRAALVESVTKAGWKVVDSSPVTIEAKIERGPQETLTFRSIGVPRSLGGTQSVTMQPYKASVRIVSAGKELWTRSSTNMVPFFLHLQPDETLEQAVKKFEKADPAFFSRLSIPDSILHPDHAKHIGMSTIKNGQWMEINLPR